MYYGVLPTHKPESPLGCDMLPGMCLVSLSMLHGAIGNKSEPTGKDMTKYFSGYTGSCKNQQHPTRDRIT